MKTLRKITSRLFFSMLLVVGGATMTQAQVVDTVAWCPAGATWTYRQGAVFGEYYTKLTYEKDTMIGGHQSKKLAVSEIQYVSGSSPLTDYSRSEQRFANSAEYYYESNDSIYWYDTDSSRFQFLYDFGASAGDEWTIVNGVDAACDSLGLDTFVCDSVRHKVYDGRLFEVTHGHMTGNNWRIGGPVIRNIGSATSPFAQSGLNCNPHLATGGGLYDLVCYYDSIRGFVNFGNSDRPCGNIINPIDKIEPSTASTNWAVYPNPTNSNIHIELLQYATQLAGTELHYEIYNASGQRLYQALGAVNKTIDMSNFANGLYLLVVLNENGQPLLSRKIVRQGR